MNGHLVSLAIQVWGECSYGLQVPPPPTDAERGELQEERGGRRAEHAEEDHGSCHAPQALHGEKGRLQGNTD